MAYQSKISCETAKFCNPACTPLNLHAHFFRGMNSRETRAFRECYGHLSELKSLIGGQVPFVALTATASTSVRDNIIKSLAMFNILSVKGKLDRKKYLLSCHQTSK